MIIARASIGLAAQFPVFSLEANLICKRRSASELRIHNVPVLLSNFE